MNRTEAFKILELPDNSSEADIKKKFKKLAAKYHPDVNKEPNAAELFKKINEAYNILTKPHDVQPQFPRIKIRKPFISPPATILVTLSFKDSIKGSVHNLTYARYIECNACEGAGGHVSQSVCQKCNGRGIHTVSGGPGIFFSTPCVACQGAKYEMNACQNCQGQGVIKENNTIDVRIPGGVKAKDKVVIPEQGHYTCSAFGHGYDNAIIVVDVTPDNRFSLENMNVKYNLEIDLLSALKGCTISVPTIEDPVEITVPPKSKHLDVITIPGYGVDNKKVRGNQLVYLHVLYPQSKVLDEVINVLEKGER